MIKGQITCRCCNTGALTKDILDVINELDDILPCKCYDLIITSGYRCKANNTACGGSPVSQHMKGNAIDCYCPQLDILGFYAILRHLEHFEKMGIGLYETEKGYYCHIDTRGYKARWHYINDQKINAEDSWLFTL